MLYKYWVKYDNTSIWVLNYNSEYLDLKVVVTNTDLISLTTFIFCKEVIWFSIISYEMIKQPLSFASTWKPIFLTSPIYRANKRSHRHSESGQVCLNSETRCFWKVLLYEVSHKNEILLRSVPWNLKFHNFLSVHTFFLYCNVFRIITFYMACEKQNYREHVDEYSWTFQQITNVQSGVVGIGFNCFKQKTR